MTTMTQTQKAGLSAVSLPNALLRIEGLTAFLGALALYANQGGSWLLFVLLLFAPDLSMVGYLANPRIGGIVYNAVHVYSAPAVLTALSLASQWPLGLQIALIWFAHIGMDRTLGFGLKYPTAFKDTHFQRI